MDVVGGMVQANGRGMSMARFTPLNLPENRRPPEWGGTGKDPVWTTISSIFTGPLAYNPDKPWHANAAAAFAMSVAAMQTALAATRVAWTRVPGPAKKPAATSGTTPAAPPGRAADKVRR